MATELEYEDIVRYKTSTDSKYRPGLSDNDKRNIREKAARYVLLGLQSTLLVQTAGFDNMDLDFGGGYLLEGTI